MNEQIGRGEVRPEDMSFFIPQGARADTDPALRLTIIYVPAISSVYTFAQWKFEIASNILNTSQVGVQPFL